MPSNSTQPESTNFLSETISLVHQIESRFMELGARLYKVRNEKLWQEKYADYEEFLEIAGISPSVASILVKVYETYILVGGMTQQKLEGVAYSKLYEAIPLLGKEDIETVVAKATLLTRSEIKDEVREEKHGECAHEEHIMICADCKKRIYETK